MLRYISILISGALAMTLCSCETTSTVKSLPMPEGAMGTTSNSNAKVKSAAAELKRLLDGKAYTESEASAFSTPIAPGVTYTSINTHTTRYTNIFVNSANMLCFTENSTYESKDTSNLGLVQTPPSTSVSRYIIDIGSLTEVGAPYDLNSQESGKTPLGGNISFQGNASSYTNDGDKMESERFGFRYYMSITASTWTQLFGSGEYTYLPSTGLYTSGTSEGARVKAALFKLRDAVNEAKAPQ